jgi:hypothetical protein
MEIHLKAEVKKKHFCTFCDTDLGAQDGSYWLGQGICE